jgi:hypothetical protein
MMRSLRSRVVGGMTLLIALVFVIALLGVSAIRALDQSVERELSLLMETTDLGSGLISSVAAEVRSAEQYLVRPREELRLKVLEQGDSAYVFQRRYRGLSSLTTTDRYIANQIAHNQAQIEVAYAMAHALTDLGRPEEARRYAELARSPSDTLLRDVRALSLAQTTRSMARAADLGRQADRRRQTLWLLFFVSLVMGVSIVPATSGPFGSAGCRPSWSGCRAPWTTWVDASARWWCPWSARPARSAPARATSPR